MNLVNLPVEVGILIFQYLDTKSKIKVYNIFPELRHFFAPCHIKKLNLSRSLISTAKTLKQDYFNDFENYIQEINLSGIPDLTPDVLKIHVARWTQLKTLDVTFTDIYLSDILDICPKNLKNISINFFKCPRKCRKDNIWEKCISLFQSKRFTSIHFIVFDFLDCDTPMIFLENVYPIEDLKVTVADNYKDFWCSEEEDPNVNVEKVIQVNFSKLFYNFRDCRVTHKTSQFLVGVSNLDFRGIEYLFIMYLERITIYVSPIFRAIFSTSCSDLQIAVSPYLPKDIILDGNIIFKAWNKDKTSLDDNFLNKVLLELKDYFPFYICKHTNTRMTVTKAASDWFCIDCCEYFEQTVQDLPEKVTLTDFCRNVGSVIRSNRPISLSTNSETLQRITYLRLSNVNVKNDFFSILFSQCTKLVTLDVYVEKRGRLKTSCFAGCTTFLSKEIHRANCLKNLKLTSEDVEYEELFKGFSQCRTLENVHICEYERAGGDYIDVKNILRFVEECENLYSLFIEADMLPEELTLIMCPIREIAQKLGRDHLNVEVCDCYRGWNPFVDVFNPSPLHILD